MYQEQDNIKTNDNNFIMELKDPCFDCGKETLHYDEDGYQIFGEDNYWVNTDLWLSVMPQEDNRGKYYLCRACIEKRLGRKLRKEDFTEYEESRELQKRNRENSIKYENEMLTD